MQNLQFIVALDSSARFVHLFRAGNVKLPIDCESLMGERLGKFLSDESDSRRLRACFAECLFTADPQECDVAAPDGGGYRFRFEKVSHDCDHSLRSEDEVVAISVITKLPDAVQLTKREQQIVQLICRDMSNVDIARELKVKASTIETHRQNIRQKLGVKGTAGLVLYAARQGLAD